MPEYTHVNQAGHEISKETQHCVQMTGAESISVSHVCVPDLLMGT